MCEIKVFAERLKRLRLEHKLSRKELAEIIGVSESTVYRWENGKKARKISALVPLLRQFKVSADYLFGMKD